MAWRSASLTRSLDDIDRVKRLAAEVDRPDLVTRLDQARTRLLVEDVPVAVVGEFKQGKSTLINALLRTDVCPVDADIVTAVPTIVRYGVPPGVIVHFDSSNHRDQPVDEHVPFARLPVYVTEQYVSERQGDGPPPRSVEVRLDRALLQSGLSFIDTPGVGGLDSAHGNITLGALTLARAALFVTDAAQELTAPELDFLLRTVERCPLVVCVVTKTDLHDQWRRILQLNRGHLNRAGLAIPMVPVSSFLRLMAAARGAGAARDSRAARESATLNDESGFPRLLRVLRRGILDSADAATVRAANQDTTFVIAQLREQVGAERAAVRDPDAGAALAQRLAEKARRSRQMTAGSASWQTVLSDGIQDLSTEVEHDLRERIRAMLRRGEALLEEGDPKETWGEFEAWAAREATAAAVDNMFTLVSRTEQLARDVAEQFDLEYDGLDLDLPSPTAALAGVGSLEVRFDKSSMRQFLSAFTAARLAYGGAFMLGAFGSILGLTIAAPVGLAVGMTLGRKLVRDERERQVQFRRQQAMQELRRYVDEVMFVVGKDSRDAVRRAQRHLRDEFSNRAAVAERSSTKALAAVRDAVQLAEDERTKRVQQLEERWRDLDRMAERVHPTGVPA